LLWLDVPILSPYFLKSFPGIVIPEGLSHEDRFQTELVDGTSAFKGLSGQFLVDFGWNTDKDPAGVIPHAIHSFAYDDITLSCYQSIESPIPQHLEMYFLHLRGSRSIGAVTASFSY
jgi:hypothetical protein